MVERVQAEVLRANAIEQEAMRRDMATTFGWTELDSFQPSR